MMLGFGWALLDAQTGENRPHSHLAHQISLSLGDSCSITADRDLRLSPGEAVLIPATTVHRLTPSGAILRNLYVDPFFMGTRDLNKSVGLERLSTAEANALALVRSGNDARKWIKFFFEPKEFEANRPAPPLYAATDRTRGNTFGIGQSRWRFHHADAGDCGSGFWSADNQAPAMVTGSACHRELRPIS